MRFVVALRASGRVEVAAYGLADAEHRVEKEIHRLWPGVRVEVLEIRRSDAGERIVEDLSVSYRLHAALDVDAPTRDEAPGEALRLVRGRLDGSRYARAELEVLGVEG